MSDSKREAADRMAQQMERLLWLAHIAGVSPEKLREAVNSLRAYEETE